MRWIDHMFDPFISKQAVDGVFGVNLELLDDGRIQVIEPPEGMNSNEFRHSTAPASTSVFARLKEVQEKVISTDDRTRKST